MSAPDRDDALRVAKRPRTVLAGPYGHPFHPIVVTIPIGAWVASLVFDVIGLLSDDPASFASAARILIVIGLAGGVLAAVLGLLDLTRIASGTPAKRVALTHMAINSIVLVIFLIGAIVRFGAGDEIPVAGFVLTLVALALLGVSGWLGGRLAYRWGVRVADEQTQREGFVRR